MRNAHRPMRMRPWKPGLGALLVGLATVVGGMRPVCAQEPAPNAPAATAAGAVAEPTAPGGREGDATAGRHEPGISWRPVLRESMLFLTAQHLTRFTEDRTVRELDGPFIRDWFRSVRSLNRFNDGGHVFTNWLAHPAMGSGEGQAVHVCDRLFDPVRDRPSF